MTFAVLLSVFSTLTWAAPSATQPTKSSALKPYLDFARARKLVRDKNYSKAQPLLVRLSSKPQTADLAHSLLAEVYESQSAWAMARQTLEKINLEDSFSALKKEARERISLLYVKEAQSLSHQKNKLNAFRSFDLGFQGYTELNRVELIPLEALKDFAKICKNQSETHDCTLWIKRLIPAFPKAALERKALQDEFPDILDERENYALGGKIFQTYKATDLDAQAYQDAFQKFYDKKYQDAEKALGKFQQDFPHSQFEQRARFFRAQSQKKQNSSSSANSEFQKILNESPFSFLGLASAFETGVDVASTLKEDELSFNSSDPYLSPFEKASQTRATQLKEAGALDLIASEFDHYKARATIQNETLLYWVKLATEAKNHSAAFQFLTELINRNASVTKNKIIRDWIFPITFWEKIKPIAEKEQLDPLLAISLIKQESAFNPLAISGSNALGLMQLLHATALDVDSHVERIKILTVDKNIELGSDYLARLLKRYNGNIAEALAAYNAGPERVDGWVKDFGSKGFFEFIEKIPYRETQNYVGSIIRSYCWYSQIILNEKITSFDRFWVSSKK